MIKVSVLMITYNHEKYIREAIEGVLMQQINFPIELIIGEDFSSDKTREIVIEYANKYPEIIKTQLPNKNIGMQENFYSVVEAAKGKYIALCEGDDFWIDCNKLQKQVNFLETKPDFGMVCTDYNKLYMSDQTKSLNCFNLQKYRNEVKFSDYILDRSTICTATVMFDANLSKSYFKEVTKEVIGSFNVGDTPLWLYIMLKSRIGVLSDVTATYRINLHSASKFVNPDEHYSFVKKGYEVPEYFLSIYNGPLKEDLRAELENRKLLSTLYYAFKIKDKKLFKLSIRDAKLKNRSMKLLLWRLGLANNFNYWLITNIFKIYKSI